MYNISYFKKVIIMITDLLRVVLIKLYKKLRPKLRTTVRNHIRIFLNIYLNS